MLEKQGLVKLMEECGELIQVAAKKCTCMDSDEHWDGAGSLKQRMEEEIGDVIASISVVIKTFDLDSINISERTDRKAKLFFEWLYQDSDIPKTIGSSDDND